MNQTKKRLAIIELAISLTDTETIQLQVLKLGMLRSDNKLQEIIDMLKEKKYAQSQMLISSYIDSPTEATVIQRTPKYDAGMGKKQLDIEESLLKETEEPLTLKEKIQMAKDKAIIDQFELFTETVKDSIPIEEIPQELENYDAFLDTASKPKKMPTDDINYDALLNVDAKDILPDNITLDIDDTIKDKNFLKNDDIPMNTIISEDEKQEDTGEKENLSVEKVETQYKAIPYIEQKLQNMQTQYPAIHTKKETFPSVNTFILQISAQGYSDFNIEEILTQVEELKGKNKAEAAQLLLLVGGTESKYAQFSLARELFKGKILEKNLSESFTLINRLAINENYPEALCDLAQFYENGIDTKKDTKKAQELYKEAMDLGIHRASEHHKRMMKQNKGLFSIFRR